MPKPLDISKIGWKKWLGHPTTVMLIISTNLLVFLFNMFITLNKESIRDVKGDKERLIKERDLAYLQRDRLVEEKDSLQTELKNLILHTYVQKTAFNQFRDSMITKRNER